MSDCASLYQLFFRSHAVEKFEYLTETCPPLITIGDVGHGQVTFVSFITKQVVCDFSVEAHLNHKCLRATDINDRSTSVAC